MCRNEEVWRNKSPEDYPYYVRLVVCSLRLYSDFGSSCNTCGKEAVAERNREVASLMSEFVSLMRNLLLWTKDEGFRRILLQILREHGLEYSEDKMGMLLDWEALGVKS